MSNQALDNLNSACCRIRGAIMTVEGIQKGSFPGLINSKVLVDTDPREDNLQLWKLQDLAAKIEPLLKALLPPMLQELKELREESR